MQFEFMPEKGTTDALFILWRIMIRESFFCVLWMWWRHLIRVPRKLMEWAMRKKELYLYEGAKTRVRVGSGLSEEFPVEVGVH